MKDVDTFAKQAAEFITSEIAKGIAEGIRAYRAGFEGKPWQDIQNKRLSLQLSCAEEQIVSLETLNDSLQQQVKELEEKWSVVRNVIKAGLSETKKEVCPPHHWDGSGERCDICGSKDWMT
jgi:hypothetical protein